MVCLRKGSHSPQIVPRYACVLVRNNQSLRLNSWQTCLLSQVVAQVAEAAAQGTAGQGAVARQHTDQAELCAKAVDGVSAACLKLTRLGHVALASSRRHCMGCQRVGNPSGASGHARNAQRPATAPAGLCAGPAGGHQAVQLRLAPSMSRQAQTRRRRRRVSLGSAVPCMGALFPQTAALCLV